MAKLIQRVCQNSYKSGLKAQYLHSPGQRPGYKVFTDNAPCKGNSMWHNRVALTGRVVRFCIRSPRALPWAVEILGFQPALYEF